MAKKKPTKRKTKSIIIAILVLILVAILSVVLLKDQLIKSRIIAGCKDIFQIDLLVDSANLQIMSSQLDLKNMEIANPEGYQYPTLLDIKEIHMDLGVSSLLSNTVEIEKMQISGMNLFFENAECGNNFFEILAHLPHESEEDLKRKRFAIRSLEITNSNARIILFPGTNLNEAVTVPLGSIRTENLAVDAEELVRELVRAIMSAVVMHGTDEIGTEVIMKLFNPTAETGTVIEDK